MRLLDGPTEYEEYAYSISFRLVMTWRFLCPAQKCFALVLVFSLDTPHDFQIFFARSGKLLCLTSAASFVVIECHRAARGRANSPCFAEICLFFSCALLEISGPKKSKKRMRYKDVVREQIMQADTAEDAISSDEDSDDDVNYRGGASNGGSKGLAYDEEQEKLRKSLLGSIAEHEGAGGSGSDSDDDDGDGLLKVRCFFVMMFGDKGLCMMWTIVFSLNRILEQNITTKQIHIYSGVELCRRNDRILVVAKCRRSRAVLQKFRVKFRCIL